jgi:hypothetical protein
MSVWIIVVRRHSTFRAVTIGVDYYLHALLHGFFILALFFQQTKLSSCGLLQFYCAVL